MTLASIEALRDNETIVDFGVHYAWLANEIAKRMPSVKVFGTERDAETIESNRNEFEASKAGIRRAGPT
jgi:precorrin-6B methylase 2